MLKKNLVFILRLQEIEQESKLYPQLKQELDQELNRLVLDYSKLCKNVKNQQKKVAGL